MGVSPMTPLIADRFVDDRGTWIDIATGDTVRARLLGAGRRGAQFAWADRCASLAVLRHPMINSLIDYGSCGASRCFEAYAIQPALRLDERSASRLRAHAGRFLERHGITMDTDIAPLLTRGRKDGPSLRRRVVGIRLVRRAVLDAVVDALDAHAPAGTVNLDVTGSHGSGLTTLRVLIAREARIRGYVPVSAGMLSRRPSLVDELSARHVCVLVDEPQPDDERRTFGRFLTRLVTASARRHVVVRLWRRAAAVPGAIPLDPMGAAAMTAMVYIDPESGPSADELFDAVRRSDGKPGLFLDALGAVRFAPHEPHHALVHETTAPYAVPGDGGRGTAAGTAVRSGKRPEPSIGGAAGVASTFRSGTARTSPLSRHERALTRARQLAARGRHAAAERLLSRAARVLEGRGHAGAAARCLHELGWMVRARARGDHALDCFARCAALADGTPAAIEALVGRGVVQADEARLIEAEATLRGAVVAAEALGARAIVRSGVLALGRTLMWQGRCDEAGEALAPIFAHELPDAVAAESWALAARIRAAEGQSSAAIEAARRAIDAAARYGQPRQVATAHRAMAVVLVQLGDPVRAREHAESGLAAARAARLPLLALRLRSCLTSSDGGVSHIATRITRLPRLLEAQLKAASGIDVSDFARSTGARALLPRAPHPYPLAQLETMLEISHGARDERDAAERICRHLCEHVRASTAMIVASGDRILALAGRPWQGDTTAYARALATARGVPPDPARQPRHAAEPIRYGGEVIAALACRWVAGASVGVGVLDDHLRPAALALASSIRSLLDEPLAVPPGVWTDLIGESAAAVRLRDSVARAARAPFPVLIEGESGSGKELVARAIHRLGTRRDRRWCAVNCAAISDELLEAELFGHARGAFTGAVGERVGLFEEADGGTLFLDEVGELSPRAQAKLLRVLQDGEVRRVGENLPRRIDVRMVAATNRRLEDDASAGRFRADLRFRLDVVRIGVPPLRDRIADIPLLALHFWTGASAQVGSRATLAPETLAALARYDWPGNVRELQNVIAWMAVHSPRRGRIGPAALPAHLAHATAPSSGNFEIAREEFERRFVRAALARAGGQRSRAAGDLGVSRQGLAKMLRRLNIEVP